MQDQKDCSLDSWNCQKKWVHVTQSQELINRVPVLYTLYNLKPVMRINEQCTIFCFSFKVFVMRFQILKAARNAVTLLMTKRLLKVAQNQNISVKRTERSEVEAWARDPFYPIMVGVGNKHPPKVQLMFLGWNSACLALSWELGTCSSHPALPPTPEELQVCVSFSTIFGSRKTEVGNRGMNFQSIAWQISTQITLLLMGFVGISFMLCFENPFHSVYWHAQGNKSVSLEGGWSIWKKNQTFFGSPYFFLCEHSDSEASYSPSSISFSLFNNIYSKESN